MSAPDRSAAKPHLDDLIAQFFRAASFEPGSVPDHERMSGLFIDRRPFLDVASFTPTIFPVEAAAAPRLAVVRPGALKCLHEAEVSEQTTIFGDVAHRFSVYKKSGTFETGGMIRTQFVRTAAGWKISAMAWDDERLDRSMVGVHLK